MYRVYGDMRSGNCYKIKLLMRFLAIEHEWVKVDVLVGETRKPAFLEKNPNGKIPVLELDTGECLSESNAILNYLADDTDFLPTDRLQRAQVLEWQFFEQYSHEPYIAVARFINKFLGLPEDRKAEYQSKQAGGHKALAVMEKQLNLSRYLVGDKPTIADISLFAYTHVASDGGFDLTPYRAIRNWIADIKGVPGYLDLSLENA